MSLVQIAYQTLLSKLREWGRLQPKEQLELLQQANSLMGASFRKALAILEESPQRLHLSDHGSFYRLALDGETHLLFKSHSRIRLNDCSCKGSWLRKAGHLAPYMCLHQILLELAFQLFEGRVPVHKADSPGTDQLA
jgi:hypothetical protein